jgi:hypothetical protein
MLIERKLKEPTAGFSIEMTPYKDSYMTSNLIFSKRHFGYCEYCPNVQNLSQMFKHFLNSMQLMK